MGETPIIEAFIAEAGIARRTLYNNFPSTAELRLATRAWLGANLIESIETETETGGLDDPLPSLRRSPISIETDWSIEQPLASHPQES
ncbi:hypothetical protein [Paludibacterium yongneupense]|uniref:hypothetical protein n=1 Tax=Paludibacterium yongneupense TaxID=400061 RepID=UPI0003F813BB|nr:hypothetical protein [Paludibacterium yongneupense]